MGNFEPPCSVWVAEPEERLLPLPVHGLPLLPRQAAPRIQQGHRLPQGMYNSRI